MLTIQDEIMAWAKLTEQELLEEIVIMLYKKQKLSFGQAAKSLNLDYSEFQHLLGKNEIPVNYDVNEFMEDMETLKVLNY